MPEHIITSVAELVGGTPLFDARRFTADRGIGARLLVKLELFNPAGSVKDRIAWAIIEDAEARGLLQPGGTIIEYTSGNTGIALAAVAAAKGYRAKLVLPSNVSVERQQLIRALGAEVVVLDLHEYPSAVDRRAVAERLAAETPGSFVAKQSENRRNPGIHRETTGPEIWRDSDGAVDILIAATGTGGTLSGAGEYLKSVKPAVIAVAVETGPASAPTPQNPAPEEIDGIHRLSDAPADAVSKTYNRVIADETIGVETEEAYEAARAFARSEGLLVGTSSGAVLWAATQLGRREEHAGRTIVAVLPDTGERYLSTRLYGG